MKSNYPIFESLLKDNYIGFEKEFQFAKELKRKWRTDYMITSYNGVKGSILAIEIEGGIYSNGRHTRASGYLKDIEKYNTYTILGIPLLRFSTYEINKVSIDIILKVLSCRISIFTNNFS